MWEEGIAAFKGKRVLLLQGPIGPFFSRLQRDLRAVGAQVWKVNFNAGDWLFCRDAMTYRGLMGEWPQWLHDRLIQLDIDTVLLFGDCRPIHIDAIKVATRLHIDVGVFEEGYYRPDFITLERQGANANSLLPRSPEYYAGLPKRELQRRSVPRSYWHMVFWGFLYFTIGGFGRGFFPHYQHHRPLMIVEMFPWLFSPLRKAWFKWKERGLEKTLAGKLQGQYFFVPLQVHNDAQVLFHAEVGGIKGFIASTIASFARHAHDDSLLVFKHHPMDRGYVDYTRLIRETALEAGCGDRVLYIHDQHTPTVSRNARGVVVINSTVGLASLEQGRPTKVCGTAVYDMKGLTFQGSLDDFWTQCEQQVPDMELYRSFHDEIIVRTQINGNFYRRLVTSGLATGLHWTGWGRPKKESLRLQIEFATSLSQARDGTAAR